MPDNNPLPFWRFKDFTNNQIYDINAVKLYRAILIALSGDIEGSLSTDLADNVNISTAIGTGKVTNSKLATDSVTTDKIADLNVTFAKLAASVYGGSIAEGTADKLATKVQVKNYVEAVISGQGTYRGKQTVATINSWTMANLNNGDHVKVDGSGTVTVDGHSLAVRDGEDLTLWKYVDGGVTHAYWQSADGEFKLLQTAVDTSGGTTMTLTRIQQNENGDIVATFVEIQSATTSQKGLVQLAGSIGATVSTENNKAASEKAVRDAINALDAIITSVDGTNVQVKVTEQDGKIVGVNVTTDDTENRNNKVTSIRGSSSATDTAYPSEKAVATALEAIETSTGNEAEVTAAALDELDSRMRAVEESVNDSNLGDRTADSIDAQVLKMGGEDLADLLGGKVDKEAGKGLSTNDFTDAYKSDVDANTQARHTHSNKSVLDGISSSDIANWNAKQAALDFMTDTDVDNLFTAAWNAANS